MGRRQNLASSGQISCASREFGVEKEKNILSSWRRVVKLVGRQYNLAPSGKIIFASREFGIEKAKNVLSSWRRVV